MPVLPGLVISLLFAAGANFGVLHIVAMTHGVSSGFLSTVFVAEMGFGQVLQTRELICLGLNGYVLWLASEISHVRWFGDGTPGPGIKPMRFCVRLKARTNATGKQL